MKKKPLIFSALILLSSIIVIAGVFTFFTLQKKEVNIFEYMKFSENGISGVGTLELASNRKKVRQDIKDETEQNRLIAVLENLHFNFDKSEKLANNDTVEISVDLENQENQKILEENKIKLTTNTFVYQLSQLSEVPNNWHDVKNKEVIMDEINQQITDKKELLNDVFKRMAQESAKRDISFDITEELQSIYYKKDVDHCDVTKIYNTDYACGTVAYIYKYNTEVLDKNFYFTKDPTMYHVHIVTNIFEGEQVKSAFHKLIREEDEWSKVMLNLADVEAILEAQGFEKSE